MFRDGLLKVFLCLFRRPGRCGFFGLFQKLHGLQDTEHHPLFTERSPDLFIRMHCAQGGECRFQKLTDLRFTDPEIIFLICLYRMFHYGMLEGSDVRLFQTAALFPADLKPGLQEPGIGTVEPALNAGDGGMNLSVGLIERLRSLRKEGMPAGICGLYFFDVPGNCGNRF